MILCSWEFVELPSHINVFFIYKALKQVHFTFATLCTWIGIGIINACWTNTEEKKRQISLNSLFMCPLLHLTV